MASPCGDLGFLKGGDFGNAKSSLLRGSGFTGEFYAFVT